MLIVIECIALVYVDRSYSGILLTLKPAHLNIHMERVKKVCISRMPKSKTSITNSLYSLPDKETVLNDDTTPLPYSECFIMIPASSDFQFLTIIYLYLISPSRNIV